MPPALRHPGERGARSMEKLAAILAALAIVLTLALSSLMLSLLGIAYEDAGGAAWQKLHPATLVAFAALVALALSRGNPVRLVDEILESQPGLIAFAAMLFVMIAYVIWRVGSPVTQFVDTFVLPILLFIVLTRLPDVWLRPMAIFLHSFMAINAIIGIAEFALGFRITPLVAEGQVITTEWRSTALLGHPLLNAAATASYAFMLIIGGGRDMPILIRIGAFAVQAMGMIVFGGRAATVFLIVFAVPAVVVAAWRMRGRYKMTPAQASALIVAVFAVIVGLVSLYAGGFFDRFLQRFIDDGGSAAARSSMFDLVAALSPQMLWFGADPDYISSLQRQFGIPFGIESFWVSMIANQGLLFSIPFFIFFMVYMNEYRRALVPGTIWGIALFLLIISTSTSLSSKTAMLAVFTIAACLLLRPCPLAKGR